MSAIRVLLVEDHETVREGLRMLLNSQPDIEVVGEAANGRLAIEYSERFRPHVVIMDLSMPEMNGLQATMAIKQGHPEMAIVALTRHDDAAFVDELRKAGASAYVLKQSASRELLDAVRVAAVGGSYLDAQLRARDARPIDDSAGRVGRPPTVSEREKQVLRMMAVGHSNKEIAEALGITIKTVEVHKANAMRKLKLRGRIDVVRYAILHGWLQEP
ncbi:MAG TPA: response regulator transcription factor [Vicinamibacterales bacterium]|nr:response regulator transcription factor [Vicinamibacterales bacterium]